MRIKQFMIFLSLFLVSLTQADMLVIVHKDNPLEQLERKQVVDLFMGRVTAFPNGQSAQTLDLRAGTPLRANFYKALTGKSEAQVDAYWATLILPAECHRRSNTPIIKPLSRPWLKTLRLLLMSPNKYCLLP